MGVGVGKGVGAQVGSLMTKAKGQSTKRGILRSEMRCTALRNFAFVYRMHEFWMMTGVQGCCHLKLWKLKDLKSAMKV